MRLLLTTLAMMASNQLTDRQRACSTSLGSKPFAVGRGFGLGVSVVLETDKSDLMRRGNVGRRSVGRALREPWWQADPKDGSVLIFLAHDVANLEQMNKGYWSGRVGRDRNVSTSGVLGCLIKRGVSPVATLILWVEFCRPSISTALEKNGGDDETELATSAVTEHLDLEFQGLTGTGRNRKPQ